MTKGRLKVGNMRKLYNLAFSNMKKTVKNTNFDNIVNYETRSSSGFKFSDLSQSSADPSSTAFLIRNSQIVQYQIAQITEKDLTSK
jgi:hypothetical protein